MPSQRFTVRLGSRSAPLLRVLGVRGPDTAFVDLTATELIARFGRFEARAAFANIAQWRIEGPWRWITAIGIRMSIRHGDLTFGGSHRGGIRLDFRQPIKVGWLHPSALYVTVENLEGLADELLARGIPGEDVRIVQPGDG